MLDNRLAHLAPNFAHFAPYTLNRELQAFCRLVRESSVALAHCQGKDWLVGKLLAFGELWSIPGQKGVIHYADLQRQKVLNCSVCR